MLCHVDNSGVDKVNCVKAFKEAFTLAQKNKSDIFIFVSKLGIEEEAIAQSFNRAIAKELSKKRVISFNDTPIKIHLVHKGTLSAITKNGIILGMYPPIKDFQAIISDVRFKDNDKIFLCWNNEAELGDYLSQNPTSILL